MSEYGNGVNGALNGNGLSSRVVLGRDYIVNHIEQLRHTINVHDSSEEDDDSPVASEEESNSVLATLDDTNSVWAQRGDKFHPSTIADNVPNLPAGIYRYVETVQGWYLEKYENRFQFPYKIYGTNNNIVNRSIQAWHGIDGNVGILLNGLKGTGKSVTAQIIANKMIDLGLPVLIVDKPLDIGMILSSIKQDCVVFWDEFEKTHARPEHQQLILSAIDGVNRGPWKRMYLLTTNQKNINENFIDRPSRIRYVWDFSNLDKSVIEELIDDTLLPAVRKFKGELMNYLLHRRVLSIDVVKAACQEVNVFKEPPSLFEGIMNLNKKIPLGYNLFYRVKGSTEPMKELAACWVPADEDFMDKLASTEFRETFGFKFSDSHWDLFPTYGYTRLHIVGLHETDTSVVYANIKVSVRDSPWAKNKYVTSHIHHIYMSEPDESCKGFINALNSKKVSLGGEDPSEAIERLLFNVGTFYGNDPGVYEVKIEPIYNRAGNRAHGLTNGYDGTFGDW
jgi:hypothetical protein